ncbi:MAG: DsbA family protein [Candidatus Pristimantibacillus sp.]
MSKPKKRQYQRPNQQQAKKNGSNKTLIFLTLAIVAVIAVVILGINNQSKPVSFDYASLPMQGEADAPVKIVEFGDYKCPACQSFAQDFKPQLEADFINTGKASFYFINYTFLGPDSTTAALAAESVYHQNNDAFWDYYKILYDNQKDERIVWATTDYLVQLAQDAKLPIDYDLLRSDIENKTYQKEVDKDNALVRPMNVTGTPSIFINGKKTSISSYEDMKAMIEKAIDKG